MEAEQNVSSQFSRLDQYLQQQANLVELSEDAYIPLDAVFFSDPSSTPPPPPPPETFKISMTGPFEAYKFRESIIDVLRTRKAQLSRRTWTMIIEFFNNNDPSSAADRTTQVMYEALLTCSKVDQKEFFDYRPLEDKRSFSCARAYFDAKMREILTQFVTAGEIEIVQMSDIYTERVISAIKNFLLNPPIVEAFLHSLRHVFEDDPKKLAELDEDEDVVKRAIKNMNIYVAPKLGRLCGLAVRDGIVLIDCASTCGLLSGGFIFKAFPLEAALTFTILCHETIHHLARVFEGDYNFSTPRCSHISIPAPPRRTDPVHPPKKNVEIGRYLELVLFDHIQPDWPQSSLEAAKAFLERARRPGQRLPIISRDEHLELGLWDRRVPSISFGAEFVYWDQQQNPGSDYYAYYCLG